MAKELLEENDGAGNTFKATAKPVLIGTAVVGATTMIFSIIMALTHGLTSGIEKLSILHPPFLLGLITGGAVIYWFTGASIQAVTTGAYRAVEFIKANIRLEGVTKASVEDSRKVVEICTQYAQKGMFNIFLGVFFSTLAFAFFEPFFFIGYLISIALFGLFQAIFMANAGGAWDNAKKIVETELKMKGTDAARRLGRRRHRGRSVQGHVLGRDEPGDQVHHALRPAGRGAGRLPASASGSATLAKVLAVAFFVAALFFVHRSFYGMRIETQGRRAGRGGRWRSRSRSLRNYRGGPSWTSGGGRLCPFAWRSDKARGRPPAGSLRTLERLLRPRAGGARRSRRPPRPARAGRPGLARQTPRRW